MSSGLGRPPAEVQIDVGLVRRLLAAQFPRWAGLPVRAVPSAGQDNAIYRLGPDLAVRLPRHRIAAEQADNQHRCLPTLAAHLPLAIPTIAGRGVPAEGYPWPWTITSWLPGKPAARCPDTDLLTAAVRLADFITALRSVDLAADPATEPHHNPATHNHPTTEPHHNPATHNHPTTEPHRDLPSRDRPVTDAIDALGDVPQRMAVIRAWRRVLTAPAWDGPPVWLHGDLHPANLLITNRQLTGVLDFGLLGLGDPAIDLIVAWTFLSTPARHAFRIALPTDEPTWERSRGWALDLALRCVAHSTGNPLLAQIGQYTIAQVLTE